MSQPEPRNLLRTMSGRYGHSPFGRWLITQAVCFTAPYFRSIRPLFTRLEPGLVQARVANRRRVQNHIRSVHAIAMCNAAELVAGTCCELSVSPALRWIPVAMSVEYKKIARSDVRAVCDGRDVDWSSPGERVLPVSVHDANGVEVFSARITMRLSEKKAPAVKAG